MHIAIRSYICIQYLAIGLLLGVSSVSAEEHVSPASCDFGAKHPNAPDEIEQFSFLVGNWSVELKQWQQGGWSPPRPQNAYWTGRYALDGMAIYDEWFDVDPALDPTTDRGANLRMYDAENQVWQMTWLHSRGFAPTDLSAELRGEKMVMWQNHPESPAWEAEFEVVSVDEWVRTQYAIDAEGNRSARFRLKATRLACVPQKESNKPE